MIYEATVNQTGEKLKVYQLHELDSRQQPQYYDYENQGENMSPFAARANKKKFSKSELTLGKEIN